MIPYLDIIIGTAGMLILLVAYFMNVAKILSVDSRKYHALNVIACTFLLIYAGILRSIPFLVLNTLWGTVSLTKLFHLIEEHAREFKNTKKAQSKGKNRKSTPKKRPKIYKEKSMKK